MSCSCSGGVKMALACSGASNVGQITNEVAKRLDTAQLARFYCLAGPGGEIDPMVASVKGADKVLVLDGCPVACGKLIMEKVGVRDYDYVVVTELGIEKNRNFELPERDVEEVYSVCVSKLAD